MQSHHSIISANLLIDGEVIAKAYFPIPLYKDKNVSVSNIVTEIQSGGNYNNIIDGEYFNEANNALEQLIASISSSFDKDGSIDAYKPYIIDGIFTDNATFIEDLKALYCYDFNDINIDEIVAAIPALRINIPKKKNNELPIGRPVVGNPGGEQQAYSLRAINNEEQYYPYKIIKSDLSSGKLTKDNEGISHYNGLVIGQVQKSTATDNEIYSYEEPKYGIYGFQEDKMTFSVDEYGDAYFGGKLVGASGTFEGTLNAQEGQIGNWYIKEGALTDSTGQIQLLPITGDDNKPAISIGGLIINAGTILGENAVINGVDIADSLVQLTAVDGNLQEYIDKVDKDLDKVENEIFKDGNQTVDPSWASITFIDSISLNENGKTINYTTKTMKVLTYGDATLGQGSFDIKE